MAVRGVGVEVGIENRQSLFHRVGGDLRGLRRKTGGRFQFLSDLQRRACALADQLFGEGLHLRVIGRIQRRDVRDRELGIDGESDVHILAAGQRGMRHHSQADAQTVFGRFVNLPFAFLAGKLYARILAEMLGGIGGKRKRFFRQRRAGEEFSDGRFDFRIVIVAFGGIAFVGVRRGAGRVGVAVVGGLGRGRRCRGGCGLGALSATGERNAQQSGGCCGLEYSGLVCVNHFVSP